MALCERAVRLEAIGERLGKAIRVASQQASALGALEFQRGVGELENSRMRKPRGVEQWSEHVRLLRAQYAQRPKPLLRLTLATDSARRLRAESERNEVLDAG